MNIQFHIPSYTDLVQKIDPTKKQSFYVIKKSGEIGIDSIWKKISRFFTGTKAATLSGEELRDYAVKQYLFQPELTSNILQLPKRELEQAIGACKVIELLTPPKTLGKIPGYAAFRQLLVNRLVEVEPSIRSDLKEALIKKNYSVEITQRCIQILKNLESHDEVFLQKYKEKLESTIIAKANEMSPQIFEQTIALLKFYDQFLLDSEYQKEFFGRKNHKEEIEIFKKNCNELTNEIVDQVAFDQFDAVQEGHERRLFLYQILQQKPFWIFSSSFSREVDHISRKITEIVSLSIEADQRVLKFEKNEQFQLIKSFVNAMLVYGKENILKNSKDNIHFIVFTMSLKDSDLSQLSFRELFKIFNQAYEFNQYFTSRLFTEMSQSDQIALMIALGSKVSFLQQNGLGKVKDLVDKQIQHLKECYNNPHWIPDEHTDHSFTKEIQNLLIGELSICPYDLVTRQVGVLPIKLMDCIHFANSQFIGEGIWFTTERNLLNDDEEYLKRIAPYRINVDAIRLKEGILGPIDHAKKERIPGGMYLRQHGQFRQNAQFFFDFYEKGKEFFDPQKPMNGNLKVSIQPLNAKDPMHFQTYEVPFDFSFCDNMQQVYSVIGILGAAINAESIDKKWDELKNTVNYHLLFLQADKEKEEQFRKKVEKFVHTVNRELHRVILQLNKVDMAPVEYQQEPQAG